MTWITYNEATFYIFCAIVSFGVTLSKTYRNGSYKTVRLWINNATINAFLSLMCITTIVGIIEVSKATKFEEMNGHILFIGVAILIGSAGRKQQEMIEKASFNKLMKFLGGRDYNERDNKKEDS